MDKNLHGKEFPGGSVVKTLLFSAGGVGSICGRREDPTYLMAKKPEH